MAVNQVLSSLVRRSVYTLTWTANGDNIIKLPDRTILSITFTSDGADGGGTLTWFVSNDGVQYDAIGVNTSADPANPTTIVSATAAGNWSVHDHDRYVFMKFTLGSSTNPTLTVTVNLTH